MDDRATCVGSAACQTAGRFRSIVQMGFLISIGVGSTSVDQVGNSQIYCIM